MHGLELVNGNKKTNKGEIIIVMHQPKVSSQHGFTMIELVLAIAILCLLIAVTVASIYDHQSHKDRNRAIHRLQEVAEWLHMQRAILPSYAGMLPADWSASSEGNKYKITLASQPVAAIDPNAVFPAGGADTFTLQAVPVGSDECGSLLLDQTGRRGVTGQGATVAACWE